MRDKSHRRTCSMRTPAPRAWLITLLVMMALLAACSTSSGGGNAAPAPTGAAATAPVTEPVTEPTAVPTSPAAEPVTQTESVTEPATQPITPTVAVTDTTAQTATQTETAPTEGAALPTVTPTTEGGTQAGATGAPAAPAAPTYNPDQDGMALRAAYQGFNQPLFVTNAADGSNRLFVVEKIGRIQLIPAGESSPVLFLDLTDRVGSSGNEQGLLGLAFPPNFTDSGSFFVNYTNRAGDTVISRFQVMADNPNQADPAGEFQVLQLDQPAANHNGGMLAFGPDGYLWIGTGDGGAANNRFGNAMNPQSLLGKMLRIDVTSSPDQPYTIPADNPWTDADWNGQDMMDEIWAIGLRNPWRYSFDRATGDLWIADVGQNQYEEVNWTPAGSPGGLNYGWSIMEGTHCFEQQGCDTSGLVLPVIEYSHGPHCSITGGYVYRGSEFPALNGVYVYGDYCSGMIWTAVPNADGSVATYPALDSELTLSSFGESESGELYATDLNGGTVYQVVIE